MMQPIIVDSEFALNWQVIDDREWLFEIRIVWPRISDRDVDPIEIVERPRREVSAMHERQVHLQLGDRCLIGERFVAENFLLCASRYALDDDRLAVVPISCCRKSRPSRVCQQVKNHPKSAI